ncbi:MAG: GIY-YIG nuclease family protein [Alphaproteobacteria bacterium]|nr:GIY-YIG nuclease family protein [Alphaproteobacteria bacterium]
MEKRYWVYIVTDKPFGTLYIGVTSDLSRRVYEHKNGLYKGFTKTYGLKMLVWCEEFQTAIEAIEAEKRIKKWKRNWKIDLIQKGNLKWRDLYENGIS